MKLLERLKKWWKGEQVYEHPYDVNAKDDLARRNMYPYLSDEEYNKYFHPNQK